ncbi:hypothetical protein [Saccharospirillum salsuginis]|uniref:Uncharacterized protein n=1 Tax=Saccharospirillum salsuginis TaxID=418750 RepID=A0A918KJ83_9GAMM|nr:hypothetical protein [Saccharospirillum salsuginis]GGX65913.1 hypothetical protein GCM10007392_36900 [Saccharospirillum salsuginis]
MKTYPDKNTEPNSSVGFEIDNAYVTLKSITRILSSIDEVTEVDRRKLFSKWDDIHIWFKYLNHQCVVMEPFGDNSRYWIGPNNPKEGLDFSNIEAAFKQYKPPLSAKLFGDLITLNFNSLFKGY